VSASSAWEFVQARALLRDPLSDKEAINLTVTVTVTIRRKLNFQQVQEEGEEEAAEEDD
jgi:hypothetical protein